ncbi:hypothetical protein [Roseomonas mucosa]|uniref:hypothetical protein n=1 Tax=Roseomonas mucosa TaxID=207340 RepID=UPI000AB023C4|nr:hypothetical protein [Roseomonas mucosa]
MSNYTMKDRWVATGLVDRLIYESETTFHAEDALALLSLLPRKTWIARLRELLPGVKVNASVPGKQVTGSSASGGEIMGRSEDRKYEFDSRGRHVLRAGQWKIYRFDALFRPVSEITIVKVLSEMEEGDSVGIRFLAGQPVAMTRPTKPYEWLVPLTPLIMSVARSVLWKKPT